MELFNTQAGKTYRHIYCVALNPKAKLPTFGSELAAGADLYSTDNATIYPHETKLIGTGLAMELPEDTFAAIFARSGLASKEGLRPANCVGVIDPDYRGEIKVALHNDSEHIRSISEGERIAQLILLPITSMSFSFADHLSSTERGTGGFGSTGTK